MKFFAYYAWHSVVNQLRKLFKTWVMVFFAVCFLLGILIGGGAVMLEEAAGPEEPSISDVTEPPEDSAPIGLDVSPMELTELAAGLIILGIFAFCALSADKNGGKIFLPADVNLLFASPMKPQSVLLFRLLTQLGTAVFFGIYLLLQLPNLTLNLGLSIWAALGIIAALSLAVAMGKLIQILLYILCTSRPGMKAQLRRCIFGLLALLGGAYFLFWKLGDSSWLQAAASFFNGPLTRWVPLWGWLKAFTVFAVSGNLPGTLLTFLALAAGIGLLTWATWHMEADFYEDAMARSEETAQLQEAAQAEKVGMVKRKKDRSDSLRRDNMRHGSGAAIFFVKPLYNRFRFAHFRIFTKTSETYLAAAIGVSLLSQLVLDIEGLVPVVLTLGVFTFFRALGNPLAEDTEKEFFLLIPEPTWKKLLCSLLGGTANCLLDLIPGLVAATVILRCSPLDVLAWVPVIVSVDFFATTVSAFINLSVPTSAGKIIKQLVMVMFIYFGLLPDVFIMAFGLISGELLLAALGCTLFNVALGAFFLSLSPLFLEPPEGKLYREPKPFTGDLTAIRKHFSRLGFGVFLILALGSGLQLLAAGLFSQWIDNVWGLWICTFAPLYAIAVPLGLLVIRRAPAAPLEYRKLPSKKLVSITLICFFLMYSGNLIGTLVNLLLQNITDAAASNPIETLAMGTDLLPRLLFMVILAPVIEEYIFRKTLIDRMHRYGQSLAVFTSALMFGLFHGNFSQFFYAFSLGLAFGYVYLISGRLRYSIGLHMLINFMGSVLAPKLLARVDLENPASSTFWMIVLVVYIIALLVLSVVGLVLLCLNKRNIRFCPAELELPKGQRIRTVWFNWGMGLMLLGCLGLFLLNLLPG